MPTQKDAEELERDTDRLVAERQERKAAADRRRQDEARTSSEAAAKKDRDNSLWIVQSSASNIASFDEQLAWLRAVLRNWKERNHQFSNLTAANVALYILLMVYPFAAMTLDLLMLSYVGREIARGTIESLKGIGENGGRGWSVPVTVVLFTVGYVIVELVLGAIREDDRVSQEWRRYAAQFALMAWVTLPLLIVIFALANSGMFSADPAKVMGRSTFIAAIGRAALFSALALLIHGIVLRFGSAVIDAYGFGFFKVRQFAIMRRIRGVERRRRQAGDDLESSFRDFHGAVTSNGGAAQAKIGPFGATTTSVVNARFDTEVIETPPPRRQRQPPENTARPTRGRAAPGTDEVRPNAGPPVEDPNVKEPSQAQQNGDVSEPEWPGTVYDMSDEDEV